MTYWPAVYNTRQVLDCLPGEVMTENGWQEETCASDMRLDTYKEVDAEST